MVRLPEDVYAELDQRLAPVDAARAAAFPGERTTRQPVHTCYVPADAVVPGLAAASAEEPSTRSPIRGCAASAAATSSHGSARLTCSARATSSSTEA